jgi:hypothetical protein
MSGLKKCELWQDSGKIEDALVSVHLLNAVVHGLRTLDQVDQRAIGRRLVKLLGRHARQVDQ